MQLLRVIIWCGYISMADMTCFSPLEQGKKGCAHQNKCKKKMVAKFFAVQKRDGRRPAATIIDFYLPAEK